MYKRQEVGTLYNEYNNMAEKLNTYIKNEYQNKLITLDAQMKSLEARINSHFLFNTLASISSIAEIDGSERLSTMSISLGNMFQMCIRDSLLSDLAKILFRTFSVPVFLVIWFLQVFLAKISDIQESVPVSYTHLRVPLKHHSPSLILIPALLSAEAAVWDS